MSDDHRSFEEDISICLFVKTMWVKKWSVTERGQNNWTLDLTLKKHTEHYIPLWGHSKMMSLHKRQILEPPFPYFIVSHFFLSPPSPLCHQENTSDKLFL